MGVIRRTASSRRDIEAMWDYVAENANAESADALLRLLDEKK